MSPAALKARSHDDARDRFFAADAEADHALDELADFASRRVLWTEGGRDLMSELQGKVEQAEAKRRTAHQRLLYTFCDYIQSIPDA